MSKFTKKSFQPLDDQEMKLMESIEQDEWQSIPNFEKEKRKAIDAAKNTVRKDKRINLRLSQKDYYQIQVKAIEEGMPYQTLISSIVHKYLNGSLIPTTSKKIESGSWGFLSLSNPFTKERKTLYHQRIYLWWNTDIH